MLVWRYVVGLTPTPGPAASPSPLVSGSPAIIWQKKDITTVAGILRRGQYCWEEGTVLPLQKQLNRESVTEWLGLLCSIALGNYNIYRVSQDQGYESLGFKLFVE